MNKEVIGLIVGTTSSSYLFVFVCGTFLSISIFSRSEVGPSCQVIRTGTVIGYSRS